MTVIRGLYRWFSRLTKPETTVVDPPDVTCTFVVQDPAARVNQVNRWPSKTTAEKFLYVIDWSFYAEEDPIVSSVWTVDGGLISVQSSFTSTTASNYVIYGNDRAVCNLINTVTLLSTAEYTQVVKLIIDNRGCAPRPEYGPGGADQECVPRPTPGPGGADLVCPSAVGEWVFSWDWGCDGNIGSTSLIFGDDFIFTDGYGGTGVWSQEYDQVTFIYDYGAEGSTTYIGTVVDVFNGVTMSGTFSGNWGSGCWSAERP